MHTYAVHHFLLHKFFYILNFLPSKFPDDESSLIETLFVSEFLGFHQKVLIILALYLEVITGLYRTKVSITRYPDDWNRLIRKDHFICNTVLLSKSLEIQLQNKNDLLSVEWQGVTLYNPMKYFSGE